MFKMLAGGLAPACCPVKLRVVGLTESTAAGAFTVTVALADLLVSAVLVAFTVTVRSAVTAGAVNRPDGLIVPPVADQVTDHLKLFATVAVNCWVLPEATVALLGETETLTGTALVVKA
jgi:hypothetical protein